MTAALAPNPILKAFDNNGAPLAGGKVFTYIAGTTTKQASYTDSTMGTPNSNPIILNARGEAAVWLDASKTYKITLSPSTDTDPPTAAIWTVDQITGGNLAGPVVISAALSGNTLTVNQANPQPGLVVSGNQNYFISGAAINTNNGTASAASWFATNGTDIMTMAMLSASYSGAYLSGGIAGKSALLVTDTATTIQFGTHQIYRGSIDGTTGAWIIAAPTAGVGLTINTLAAGGNGLTVTGALNNAIQVTSSAAAGAADIAIHFDLPAVDGFYIGVNASGSTNGIGALTGTDYIYTNQNRPIVIGTQATARLTVGGAGNVTINEPSSGVVLSVGDTTNGKIKLGVASSNIVMSIGNYIAANVREILGAGGAGTYYGTVDATSCTFATNSVGRIGISSAGAVTMSSVGTTASAANAFLDGAANNNLLRSTSSIRYKQDVQDTVPADHEMLLSLRPITYRSLAPADDQSLRWYGLIAEEVAQVAPRLVQYTVADDDSLVPDGVQYERIGVLMLAWLQSAEARLLTLEGNAKSIKPKPVAPVLPAPKPLKQQATLPPIDHAQPDAPDTVL